MSDNFEIKFEEIGSDGFTDLIDSIIADYLNTHPVVVSPEEIAEAVEAYFVEHPIDAMTEAQVISLVTSMLAAYTPDVDVTQKLSSGVEIAEIDVHGTKTKLYAPQGGGGGSTVEVTPILQSGVKIAEIEVDGNTSEIYAPQGGGSASALDDLTDVDITNPASGDVLSYDGEKWANVPPTSPQTTSCEFVHEPQYVACVGAEFNIYFDNISKTVNNEAIYFAASSNNNNIPITVYEERLSITPTNANVGTATITVKARRKDTGAEVASTTFTLRVVAKTNLSRYVRVMLIGDSITNGGWNYNLPNMMNVTFYGTLGTSPRNHEGRVSWKASDYCTQQSYNNYTNPFYNPNKAGTIKFDFAYYMANHPTFADVDYVNIMLGRNDGYTAECVQYIKAMVDDILAYNNNIRVTVSYGYQKGYQIWEKDRYAFSYTAKTPIFTFDANLRTTFGEYERVDLIPTFVNTDNIYDHGASNKSRSARNTTFNYPVYVSDGVHFITQGYYKIGDVYYNYLNYLTDKYPLPVDPTVVDKTVLNTNISNANTLINDTSISVDGTDVSSTDYWCTQAAHDAYASAITTAQGVYDDTEATQTDVDDAIADLAAATTTFNAARQPGSAEPSVTPPVSRPYYALVHNTTQDTYYYVGWRWGPSGNTSMPTAFRITKNSGNNKVYTNITMSNGSASGTHFGEYTSEDGHTWSAMTDKANTSQWDITSYIGFNDNYEIMESVWYTE